MITRNKISDLTFCKNEYIKHPYFIIRNDDMYLTDDFVKQLPSLKDLSFNNKKSFLNTGLHTKYGTYNMYRLDIHIKHTNRFINDPYINQYSWLVCGSSGSHGFNGMNYTKKEQLGVKTKRNVIKYMVDYYLNSDLSRYEKIQKIKNKING